jgi:hypothetical protein
LVAVSLRNPSLAKIVRAVDAARSGERGIEEMATESDRGSGSKSRLRNLF